MKMIKSSIIIIFQARNQSISIWQRNHCTFILYKNHVWLQIIISLLCSSIVKLLPTVKLVSSFWHEEVFQSATQKIRPPHTRIPFVHSSSPFLFFFFPDFCFLFNPTPIFFFHFNLEIEGVGSEVIAGSRMSGSGSCIDSYQFEC